MVISQIQSPDLRFRISDILHAFWLPEWGVHIACLSDSQWTPHILAGNILDWLRSNRIYALEIENLLVYFMIIKITIIKSIGARVWNAFLYDSLELNFPFLSK